MRGAALAQRVQPAGRCWSEHTPPWMGRPAAPRGLRPPARTIQEAQTQYQQQQQQQQKEQQQQREQQQKPNCKRKKGELLCAVLR